MTIKHVGSRESERLSDDESVMKSENRNGIALKQSRIWEIDGLRGVAIFCMVLFHFLFDLNEFAGVAISYREGWVYWVGKLAVILFMTVAGISHVLTRNDIKRGLKVSGFALAVTAGSFLFTPQLTIVFGVLHFFAFAMLTTPLWRQLPNAILLLLTAAAWSGVWWLGSIDPATNLWAWLGIRNEAFTSGDYYPLIPWMGWYWLGMVIGRRWYHERKSLLPEKLLAKWPFTPLHWAGQQSIWIYLIHQPILVGFIAAWQILHESV
jgi:uncharacterized membrane protein